MRTKKHDISLNEFLLGNFSQMEIEDMVNARTRLNSLRNLDEAKKMAYRVDCFWGSVFDGLVDVYNLNSKEMDNTAIFMTQVPIPMWDESFDTWSEPLFYTNLSTMIYLSTNFLMNGNQESFNYREVKKNAYKRLSPRFFYKKNGVKKRVGCSELNYPSF